MDALKVEQGSDNLLACRICLAWDTKLYSISKCELNQMFTNVTGMTVLPWDGYPQYLCSLCRMQLLNAQALRVRCCRAEELLRQSLLHQRVITNKYIQTIERSAYKLTYNFNIHTQPPPEIYVHQETDILTDFIKDEIEIDVTDNLNQNDMLHVKNDSN